jgi:hypothetical protein
MRKLISTVLALGLISTSVAQASMIDLGIPKSVKAAGITACSQYNSFDSRVVSATGSHLTGSDATNYSTLICGLVTDGVWSKLDALYIFAAPNQTVANLNLVSTSYAITAHGSPAFAAYQGYTGVDASSTVYLDTGFNPTTAGSPNYTQNAASIGSWFNDNHQSTASGGNSSASWDGTNGYSGISELYSDNASYFRINDICCSAGVNIGSSAGFFVAVRNSFSNQDGYYNATNESVSSVSSAALSNLNFFLLSINNAGSASGGDGHQQSAAFIGGNLTAADVSAFYARIGTYRTAVGL